MSGHMAVVRCTDATGVEWEVFEVGRIATRREIVREQLANGWLCFQRSDGHKIRVAREHTPNEWQALSPASLLALMNFGLPTTPAIGVRERRD
jgi:hypothetical protein